MPLHTERGRAGWHGTTATKFARNSKLTVFSAGSVQIRAAGIRQAHEQQSRSSLTRIAGKPSLRGLCDLQGFSQRG